MDKKQYEVMSLIMAKGRRFLDEIYKLMSDNGLLDENYEARFMIDNCKKVDIGCEYLSCVEVIKNVHHSESEERWSSRTEQWNKDGKGWKYQHDPLGKTGYVPEDDDLSGDPFGKPESNDPATGETAEADVESGNCSMWFSADDNDPPMVCRGDLNGSMAESDTGV